MPIYDHRSHVQQTSGLTVTDTNIRAPEIIANVEPCATLLKTT